MTDEALESSIPPDARVPPAPLWATWGPALALLLAALALVVLLFLPTAESIVAIWQRSEAFAHGFLIVPISLWLVWEKRDGLRQLRPAPTPLPLLLFLPLGAGWLLGALVSALVVEQFAFVGMLMVTIWAVLGHRVAGYLAFPILFLLFGVPVGEGLIYPLMNFTADFTVGMLKLVGIPVYREGTFFTIPSGRWSVVEACSGLRYLIAAVTLGALYAYLTYTRWWKRVLFFLFSIGVPIIANGLRAFMIVMIGHLSDMTLAVGVDHLIYGWVFFGIVITIMFMIGAIWRDPPAPLPLPASGPARAISRGERLRLFGVLLLAAGVWPLANLALADRDDAVAAVALHPPSPAGGWTLAADGPHAWDWRPIVVGADGSLYQFFAPATPPETPVGLYVGVYRTQRQGAELVSTANMMVSQLDKAWSDLAIVPHRVTLPDRELDVQQHSLISSGGRRLLVWSWYRVGDHHTANPYLAKLIEALTRVVGRRGEAALLAVAAPYRDQGGQADAEALLTRFIEEMLPAIDAEIDRAVRP